MAERMTVELSSLVDQDILNVSATVGQGGVNDRSDVFLVQTLLWEVLPHKYRIPHHELPLLTGTFDAKTASLIKSIKSLTNDKKLRKTV